MLINTSKYWASVGAFFTVADTWTGKDKKQHFVGGLAIGFIVTMATEDMLLGFEAGSGVGLVKEVVYDALQSDIHTCSYKDWFATSAGTLMGCAIAKLIIMSR